MKVNLGTRSCGWSTECSECLTWCDKARTVGALEKNVQKSMLLCIGENFFSHIFRCHPARFPQAEQSFTFLVTPSIKQSMVRQFTAVYAARSVKEPMSWGQTGSEVGLNGPMALQLLGGIFFFRC